MTEQTLCTRAEWAGAQASHPIVSAASKCQHQTHHILTLALGHHLPSVALSGLIPQPFEVNSMEGSSVLPHCSPWLHCQGQTWVQSRNGSGFLGISLLYAHCFMYQDY